MREQIMFFWFLLSYLSCALAYLPKKSCNDCSIFQSCNAATVLLNKREATADAKLQAAFCGYDDGGLPMVCCLELPTPEPTSSGVETAESVEGHPNLSLLPDNCGNIDGDRILGGHVADLYEYPWMVLLSYKGRHGLYFGCGGSLINERYVLTTAHCIVNHSLAGVRVGEHDIDSNIDCEGEPPEKTCETNIQGGTTTQGVLNTDVDLFISGMGVIDSTAPVFKFDHPMKHVSPTCKSAGLPLYDMRIEEKVTHPGDSRWPKVRNDIALLRLKRPVVFARNARPICLPVTNVMQNRDVGGLNATVAGWGASQNSYRRSKLMSVDVPVHTKASCSQHYNRSKGEDETANKLCAGAINKDACEGDSGGPLMIIGTYKTIPGNRFIQYGIVSYGSRICGSATPSVYTDVSKYMKWILDNIRP